MKVEVNPDDVQKLTTDDRGRVYLGTEYANTEVEVAVLDSDKSENSGVLQQTCDDCGDKFTSNANDKRCSDCRPGVENL